MLTKTQIDQFERQGYLVVPDLVPADILDAVRREYIDLMDEIYAEWQAEGRIGEPITPDFWGKLLTAYRAGLDWFEPMDISLPSGPIAPDSRFHYGPAVFNMLTCRELLDVAESLLGPELMSNPIQHVRIKPPAVDLKDGEDRPELAGTAWHQDRGVTYAVADRTRMITVWIAVTDATVENGCLIVEPKAQELLPHCPQLQTSIVADFLKPAEATPVPVKAGSIIILHPLTPHASLDNRTQGFRWSFDIRYHATGEPSGRDWFPSFVARSRSAPETEIHDWRAVHRMWEEARDKLALEPHIPIHRWRSDSPYCA